MQNKPRLFVQNLQFRDEGLRPRERVRNAECKMQNAELGIRDKG